MTRNKDMLSRPVRGGSQHSRDFAVAYLNTLVDDAGEEEFTAALGRIARVSGGPKLLEKVELSAPSFYRTLSRRANPELKSVATLLKAMGIRLILLPLENARSRGPTALQRTVRRETRTARPTLGLDWPGPPG